MTPTARQRDALYTALILDLCPPRALSLDPLMPVPLPLDSGPLRPARGEKEGK